MRQLIATALLACLIAGVTHAETIVTENGHFRVHYTEGARETAKEVAIVAEEVWYQLVTAFHLHEQFKPVDILVTDNIDQGNGYADYYQNQVVIWATNLNYPLRGTHRWLRDVVAHELGHIFSLKLAKKYPFRYGLIQASVLNSGTADIGIALPIYSLVTPSWWVEGIAQYESRNYGGDWWDSNRDMLLRMATLEDDLLSYSDMGVFAHNWLKSEMVYNQGFALTTYIGERWGVDAPRELAGQTGYVTFNSALKDVIHMGGGDLYDDWTDHLRERYAAVADSVGTTVEGSQIADEGTYDWSPKISPDGTRIAWVTNHGEDYLLTEPRILHVPTGRLTKIDERVSGELSWFPSGDRIVYAKYGRGSLFLDLYVYDLADEEETRITSQLRARDPAVSPDGEWIAFVSTEDGGNRLGMIRSNGSELRWLTNDRRSENDRRSRNRAGDLDSKTSHLVQLHGPAWSPDGERLLFSIFGTEDRDIAMIGTGGPYFSVRDALSDSAAFPDTVMYPSAVPFQIVAGTEADERVPAWLPDGSGFLYAADHGGIFNIYRSELPDSGEDVTSIAKLTNVLGGAFQPDVAQDGTWFTYVGYHANDFSAYSVPLGAGDGPSARTALAEIPRRQQRDYQYIEPTPSADELFHTGPTIPSRTLVGWVPRVRVGPNFIGDDFTVNHVGGGVAAQITDQASGRLYYADVELTKNLQRKDPPSLGAVGFIQQSLRPIRTTEWTMRPSVYAFGSYYQLGVASDQNVTSDSRGQQLTVPPFEGPFGQTITQVSNQSYLRTTDSLTVWDNYYYRLWGIGAAMGFGRNRFNAQVYRRRYQIEEVVDRKILNYSKLYDADTGADVTDYFPWGEFGFPVAGGVAPILWEKRPQFDTYYFEERTLGFGWSHGSITPTADGGVNPTGGHRISLSYRFHRVTLADSLAPEGIDADGDGFPDLIDPTKPSNRRSPRKLSINEITASILQLIRMPGPLRRHTLALYGVAGYMDQPLKYYDPQDSDLDGFTDDGYLEGWAYWPLRYRLGGGGTLRGYPYFSHEGSKIAFFRASYVFPIIPHYGIQLLNLYHDRTYGAFFIEGGSTWNWERWSERHFYREDFLWDVGFEIRTAMTTFYRLPVTGYAAVARRMKDVPLPFADYRYTYDLLNDRIVTEITQPDRYRLYFGLALGFGGGAHNPTNGTPTSHAYHGIITRPDALRFNDSLVGTGNAGGDGFWAPVAGTPFLAPTPAPQYAPVAAPAQ